MATRLEIRVLGKFEVRLAGQVLDLPSRPAQSLLAYLALTAGVSHRRERLAGLLWPDSTDANARGYLRQTLWRLRKALERDDACFFLTDELSIAFDPDSDYWLDAAELVCDAAPDAGPDAAPDEALDHRLGRAAVYEGELLPGFQDEWVFGERERLNAAFEETLSRALDQLVAEGRWPAILEWGERWIALSHAPEPAYRALMSAHAGLGQMSGVATVYHRCVEALRRELDVEPSEATRALYERLSKGEPPLGQRPGISTIPSISGPVGNLPRQLTSFIGRERETGEVKHLLAAATARLVTLTGSGGCGKTRLAIQVGHELQAEYPQGAWFVELAPLTDPTLVPQTIATTLGLRGEAGRPILTTLTDYLRVRKTLLILDNCEHLIAACAQLVEGLLRASPELLILASSREALGVAGETVFRVPSLSTPDSREGQSTETLARFEAVRLFIDRAATTRPDFVLTEADAPALARICHRLDGIPLAIELAAARVSVLRVEQIAARLDDRFRLLTGGSRTALPRQQTLRALIDWSYGLLVDSEPALLRRLSVFAGGWTLEAAEAVGAGDGLDADSILDLLTQLVNKSLVMVEQEYDTEVRYRLLETIRQYAREKLVEVEGGERVRQRHLAYCLKLAEQAEPELVGPEQGAWLGRLDMELDNMRVALEWALESDVEAGLRLASALGRFWDAHGHIQEGVDWIEQLARQSAAHSHPAALAKALAVQSILLVTLSYLTQARTPAEQSLALFRAQGDPVGQALALMAVGEVFVMQGEIAQGRPYLEESLALYRARGDKLGQAEVLGWLRWDHHDPQQARALRTESLALYRELNHVAGIAGGLAWLALEIYWEGNYVTPLPMLEEAMIIQRQLGSKAGMAHVLEIHGNLAFRQGDYQRAETCYEESIALMESAGQHLGTLWTRVNLGYIAVRQGQAARAQAMLAESVQNFRAAALHIGVVYAVEGLASLAAAQGRPDRAMQLFAWADAMRRQIGDSRPPAEQFYVDRDLAQAKAQFEAETAAALSAAGQRMNLDQAIAFALEKGPNGG